MTTSLARVSREIRRARRAVTDLEGARTALYVRASKDPKKIEISVEDQETTGLAWIEANGCVLAGTYRDNHRSASRFATKEREAFTRLLADLRAGAFDVVWFWELTRSQRRLAVFAELRDLCRDLGVLWVVSGRVYDVSSYMDVAALGFAAVQGEVETELLSERVSRGVASNATRGRPHGRKNYGYRRYYTSESRASLVQEPDEAEREAVGTDGAVRSYSPAGIVREIFERLEQGTPLITLERDFTARGVPSPTGGARWNRKSIRAIALNPAYIGRRVFHGEVLEGVETVWKGLVDEERFWAVNAILTGPKRRTDRSGKAKFLLSYTARCDVCSDLLWAVTRRHKVKTTVTYLCRSGSACVAVRAEDLDPYVEAAVVAWLASPDLSRMWAAAEVDDQAVSAARTETARLRAELEELYRDAKAGRAGSPRLVAETEAGLLGRIAEQERRAVAQAMPPVLRGVIGEHAAEVWKRLTLAARRDIIRMVAEVRVKRARPGDRGRRASFGPHRVSLRWTYADEPAD